MLIPTELRSFRFKELMNSNNMGENINIFISNITTNNCCGFQDGELTV